MHRLVWLIILMTSLFSLAIDAKPLTEEKVPEPLKPWINWVLQDNPEQACPFLYNSYEQKRCSWPTATQLDLTSTKGRFFTRWLVYADSWISLPGDNMHWPQNVTVDNKAALVMDREGVPSIKLTADSRHQPVSYQISGDFFWDSIPDNLSLPVDSGLINLNINGLAIPSPTIREGQLWLKESEIGQKKPESVQNNLDIQVFRKIIDEVPLQVLTRLVLDISGEQRELKLPKPMPDGFIPLSLDSPLPARIEPDGQLLLQVRPGRWDIDITARIGKAPEELPFPTAGPDWPQAEIWVFDARPDLRLVEITGLESIDTSLANLPEDWKSFPAYRIGLGQAMGFKTLRRGDPEPEPNRLSLTRKLWLDFDGSGYTVNDAMTGKMSSGWRLNALPETHLGKVTLNGDNQLITQQKGTHKQGVEVRKGSIALDADSRIVGAIASMSAVGWEQRFDSVGAELNLPPGWRLLAAGGVDNVPDSWVSRWSLLDLFLVLIGAVGTGMLWNKAWGAFALLTLAIIWHESGAPHFVWLWILAATALLRLLPPGSFFKFIRTCRHLAGLALVLIAIPFMVDQVRMGLYPQLEMPYQPVNMPMYPATDAVSTSPLYESEEAPRPMASSPSPRRSMAKAKQYAYDIAENVGVMDDQGVNFERIDAGAHVQTGPGLPQWQWHKVMLSWNGSVDADQALRLWYLSPAMTMWLNFIRVICITLLALLMFGVAERFKPPFIRFRSATPLCLWFLLLPLLAMPAKPVYADFPSKALLTELKNRLQEVETPDCLPACAQIQQMSMSINEQVVDITLQIHVQESVMLPLPSDYGQWFPNQVLDNDTAASALFRENNGLWIHLKPGVHRVMLRGVTPLLSKFTLPLPLKPKRVMIEKSGWEVVGLHENASADQQLQFSRIEQSRTDKSKPALEPGVLPAFVRVERTLQLGLDWRVITQITRISPPGSPIVLTVPLLPHESVTSAGVRVKDGNVEVNIPAQQTMMQWQSTLEKSESIALIATPTEQWTEVWKADISPIWHLETTGIAMIHLDNSEQWLPEWHPWPGEKITLQITRPEAASGQTLTIDNSSLGIKPGQRNTDAELSFSLRSSLGTQHTLTLPDNAELRSVAIDGQTQPIRQQGRKLTLPVHPGKQSVMISWQAKTEMSSVISTPKIDLGAASSNANLTVGLGEDRWVLFALGPRLGPAVLFWGVLIVIFIVALGLGKIKLTPLSYRQWFLLLIGLSQIPIELAGIVIAWLMLLGWRAERVTTETRYFNGLQVLMAGMTLLSLGVLYFAVAQGLLSSPDMRITGNQSSALNLNWYQDRSLSTLPVAKVISVPILVYRLLMLAWSLWLAVSLLAWLKWGWECFSRHGLWKKKVPAEQAADIEKP